MEAGWQIYKDFIRNEECAEMVAMTDQGRQSRVRQACIGILHRRKTDSIQDAANTRKTAGAGPEATGNWCQQNMKETFTYITSG